MSDYFDRIEQQILLGAQTRPRHASRRRVRLDVLVPALTALVAVAVALVFLSLPTSRAPVTSPAPITSATLVYRAEPTPGAPVVTREALRREITAMRSRARARGLSGVTFALRPGDRIAVFLPHVRSLRNAEAAVGIGVRLAIFDWEADALTPSGRTVAAGLRRGDASADRISQGESTVAPGASSSQAGALSLFNAVKLAAAQPAQPMSAQQTRPGSEYFVFGSGGGSACSSVAREEGTKRSGHSPCLLEPPVDLPSGVSRHAVDTTLAAGLPAGVRLAQAQVLTVKQGTTVLEGVPESFSRWPAFGSPAARYYVLRDDATVFGNELDDPTSVPGGDGIRNVNIRFLGTGAHAFGTLSARIAARGARDSAPGRMLEQHFAVAIDDQLLVVPFIDPQRYPHGLPDLRSTTIVSGLSAAEARQIVADLHLATLPLNLRLISVQQITRGGATP